MKVVNCHHFGGVDKLPPNVAYIGRPSPYGNIYSSKGESLYTREEAVALHRSHLYDKLIDKTFSIPGLRQEFCEKDLGCWCKSDRAYVACHGDNYIHVLDPSRSDRLYDKSVLFYLADDLRTALKTLYRRLLDISSYTGEWWKAFVALDGLKLEIESFFDRIKRGGYQRHEIIKVISYIVFDLERALASPEEELFFRCDHIFWNINRFIMCRNDREGEPRLKPPLTRRPKPRFKKE